MKVRKGSPSSSRPKSNGSSLNAVRTPSGWSFALLMCDGLDAVAGDLDLHIDVGEASV